MNVLVKVIFPLILLVNLAACGGGADTTDAEDPTSGTVDNTSGITSDNTNSSTTNVLTGVFIDAEVEGLDYRTETQSGTTNSSGQFKYKNGEKITFSIGNLDFPTVYAAKIITPLDMANVKTVDNPTVINVARLLQTLDSDGNPDNGIVISQAAHQAAAELGIPFWDQNFDSNQVIEDLVAISDAGFLKEVEAVKEHLREHLAAQLDSDGDGIPNSTDPDDDNDGIDDDEDITPQDSTAALLIGTWQLRTPSGTVTISFNAGKTPGKITQRGTLTINVPGYATENRPYHYTTEGNIIHFRYDYLGGTDTPSDIKSLSQDVLELYNADNTIGVYDRISAANELVGSDDLDGDGKDNQTDTDDDGDSWLDIDDAFPNDYLEWLDSDGDSVGDNADLDDDNDLILDEDDLFPLDYSRHSLDTPVVIIINGDRYLVLTWAEIELAESYNIYIGTNSEMTPENYETFGGVKYSSDDPTITIEDLLNDEGYYIYVTTVINGEESSVSVISTATPLQDDFASLGGLVDGLDGSLTVSINGGDTLVISENGYFEFENEIQSGEDYSVLIVSLPTDQSCLVTNASGTSTRIDIENIVITCIDLPTPTGFSIDASSSSNTLSWDLIEGASYVLYWNNTGDPTSEDNFIIITPGDSSYIHADLDDSLLYYYILVQVDGDHSSPQSDVLIGNYPLEVIVTGLAGSIVLQNNFADDLSLIEDGHYAFNTPQTLGASYNVSVLNQPFGQYCSVSSGSGVYVQNTASVVIECVDNIGFQLEVGVKQLNFSWNMVENASYYQLYVNAGGDSGFTQVGDNLNTTSVAIEISAHLLDWMNTRYLLLICNADDECISSDEIAVMGQSASSVAYFKPLAKRYYFGSSVAMSADATTLAVASSSSEKVTIFEKANDIWAQSFEIDTPSYSYYFARSLALSGDGSTLVVSDPYDYQKQNGISSYSPSSYGDSDGGENTGAVYLYRKDGFDNSWALQAYMKASNATSYFKEVWSPYGSYTVMQGDTYDWNHEEKYFGAAVTLSADGNTLAVGATAESGSSDGVDGNQYTQKDQYSGAVYIFKFDTSWTQQAYVKASNIHERAGFGSSVSLSADGLSLAVGASGEGSINAGINSEQSLTYHSKFGTVLGGIGALYMFVQTDDVWTETDYIKPAELVSGAKPKFGSTVVLSADGSTVAISASADNSNAMGIDGDIYNTDATESGATYVFRKDMDNVWSQQAYIKSSNTDAYDYFGSALSISADGNILAIGAFAEASMATGLNGDQFDNSARNSGAVYLLVNEDDIWSHKEYIKAPNTGEYDSFGVSLAISADGSVLAVGASNEAGNSAGLNGDQSDNNASNTGAVYLY